MKTPCQSFDENRIAISKWRLGLAFVSVIATWLLWLFLIEMLFRAFDRSIVDLLQSHKQEESGLNPIVWDFVFLFCTFIPCGAISGPVFAIISGEFSKDERHSGFNSSWNDEEPQNKRTESTPKSDISEMVFGCLAFFVLFLFVSLIDFLVFDSETDWEAGVLSFTILFGGVLLAGLLWCVYKFATLVRPFLCRIRPFLCRLVSVIIGKLINVRLVRIVGKLLVKIGMFFESFVKDNYSFKDWRTIVIILLGPPVFIGLLGLNRFTIVIVSIILVCVWLSRIIRTHKGKSRLLVSKPIPSNDNPSSTQVVVGTVAPKAVRNDHPCHRIYIVSAIPLLAIIVSFSLSIIEIRVFSRDITTTRNGRALENAIREFAARVDSKHKADLDLIKSLKDLSPIETAKFYAQCLNQRRFGALVFALPRSFQEDFRQAVATGLSNTDSDDWNLFVSVVAAHREYRADAYRLRGSVAAFMASDTIENAIIKPMTSFIDDPLSLSLTNTVHQISPTVLQDNREHFSDGTQNKGYSKQKKRFFPRREPPFIPDSLAGTIWWLDSFLPAANPQRLKDGDFDRLLIDPILSGILDYTNLDWTPEIKAIEPIEGLPETVLVTFADDEELSSERVSFLRMEDSWVPDIIVTDREEVLDHIRNLTTKMAESIHWDDEEKRILSDMTKLKFPASGKNSLAESAVRFMGLMFDFQQHGIDVFIATHKQRVEKVRDDINRAIGKVSAQVEINANESVQDEDGTAFVQAEQVQELETLLNELDESWQRLSELTIEWKTARTKLNGSSIIDWMSDPATKNKASVFKQSNRLNKPMTSLESLFPPEIQNLNRLLVESDACRTRIQVVFAIWETLL